MASFRRFVALFLLAWMPLQVLAVPLLTWHCASHEDAGFMARDVAGVVPCHAHEEAAVPAAPGGNGEPDQDPETSSTSGDFCCSHFSAAPPALALLPVGRVPFEVPVPTQPAFSFLSRPLTQPPRA
jgi:hypothetical protein